LTNPGFAGYGGLIHKYDDNFQIDFFGTVGISNILHVEIQARLEVGYRKIVLL
jgi:hypothetical protein